MVIYLGPWLLRVSSDLTRPAFDPMQLPQVKFEWAFLILPPAAGGSGTYLVLLRVGFTKLPRSLRVLVSFYLTFSPLPCGIDVSAIPQGGIFSVALSLPPVKWRLCLLHREQSVLRTTLPCGARTFLPSWFPYLWDIKKSDHLFPFDSPLLLRFLKAPRNLWLIKRDKFVKSCHSRENGNPG